MAARLSDIGRLAELYRQGFVQPNVTSGTLADLGNRQRSQIANAARSVGQFVAPNLTSYLTEPEVPYETRLRAAGGAVGQGGQLVAPPSGKVPMTPDPRVGPAAGEAFDIASSLVPTGGAAKAAAVGAGIAARTLKPGMLRQLTGPKAAEEFHAAISAAKEASEAGRAVTLKDVKDYAQEGVQLFTTRDKKAGYAIMPSGDVVSVFKHPDAPYSGAGPAIARSAVQQGGTHLDAYDTVLPGMYEKANFASVARLPWNPKHAPPDWAQPFGETVGPPSTFTAFSGKTPTMATRMKDVRTGGIAEPDIVGMVANPPGPVKDLPVRDFGDLETLQKLAMAGRHPVYFQPEARRALSPGVYRSPEEIVAEAASRVGPEDPALYRLWGVHRPDLKDIALQRERDFPSLNVGPGGVGTMQGPPISVTPGGYRAAVNVFTPENIARQREVLERAREVPGLFHGGYGWYIQDPLFEQMQRIVGQQNAMRDFPFFNAFLGSHSPQSDVLKEINRGTGAYMAFKQGWLPEYIQCGSRKAGREIPPDVLNKLEGIGGHLAHDSQTANLMSILTGGQLTAPKTTPYIQAGGVPQTGFSWLLPAFDAMMARSSGLANVRTAKTLGTIGGAIDPGELAAIAPRWRGMAESVGMNPVGAQGVQWTAFGPFTGVETELGAPKLELMAKQIMRRHSEIPHKSPEQIRDEGLAGLEHWLVPLIGPTAAAGFLAGGQSAPSLDMQGM